MQRISRLSVLCLVAGAAMSACSPELVTVTPVVPTAGVRFINALPDSAGAFGLDFRFVDIVENSAQFRVPFRNAPTTAGGVTVSIATQYKPAQAARAGQMKLTVIEETIADPGSRVALRVINAGTTPLEVRTYPTGGTVPTAPTWASVGALTASSFVNADTGSISYNVREAGTTTNLFADQVAMLGQVAFSTAGAAGKLDIEPIPGTRIAGSAVTLVVFPRSTAGARTPQTAAFLVPAGSFMWDRRPPRGF